MGKVLSILWIKRNMLQSFTWFIGTPNMGSLEKLCSNLMDWLFWAFF